MKKLTLDDLLELMEKEHSKICRKITSAYKGDIYAVPGSTAKHQAWEGGYIDHLIEVMNIGVLLYNALDKKRRLKFSLSSTLFVLFMHDMDKLFRFGIGTNMPKFARGVGKDYPEILKEFMKKDYRYILTVEEFNAIKYVHGEGEDYHPTEKVMLPLATLVHCCDIISARIWFDEGKNREEW